MLHNIRGRGQSWKREPLSSWPKSVILRESCEQTKASNSLNITSEEECGYDSQDSPRKRST